MSKIKVAEMFYSLQGEGMYAGVPSVFLRTFGCNFTCGGFGMPRGEKSIEHTLVDPSKYSKYDELPLVHTGCDSYASWDVRFKHLSPLLEVEAIAKHLASLIPNNKWSSAYDDIHLILTGGEPLLGWQRAYPDLLDQPEFKDLWNITFETNGTQKMSDQLAEYFNTHKPHITVTFSISAKLPVSGEAWEEAVQPEVIKTYLNVLNSQLYFKFVVGTEQDMEDVHRAVATYREAGINVPVYIMPVGGTDRLYFENNRWVANIALANGYRYSPRLQVDIWKNAWGT